MSSCGEFAPDTAAESKLGGARFVVQDMTCGHCAGTIRSALEKGVPGMAFTVDLETQTVTVAGDAGRAEAVIRDAGYAPELLVG